MTVYLLHFDRHYYRARHYLGHTKDLEARLARHRAGRGARVLAYAGMEVVAEAGIGWTLARTWEGGRDVERRLKAQKNSPRFCPLCRGAKEKTE